MYGAQVEELIAERVAFALLRKNVLQGYSKLAQSRCFRPTVFWLVRVDRLGEESPAAVRALVEAGHQLFAEGTIQRFNRN